MIFNSLTDGLVLFITASLILAAFWLDRRARAPFGLAEQGAFSALLGSLAVHGGWLAFGRGGDDWPSQAALVVSIVALNGLTFGLGWRAWCARR
ncbi:MAG TPA: hypothetical protein PLC98_16385 [Anaerolineales bacterium]|nr:hypothetical protein [Anaerolineales bacterium]